METVLGIDLGTSGLKALLVGPEGQLFGEGRASLASYHERPGLSEQDPADWWSALAEALGRLKSEHANALKGCRAVGVSGQMHGAVLLDRAGEVRRQAILWNDSRAAPECEQVTRSLGLEKLLELAGNRAFAGFTAPKILWLRHHEPEVLRDAAHLMLPKDYLTYRLTRTVATDVSDASGTLLLDVGARRWSEALCETWEVDPEWLPPVHESQEIIGHVADDHGLPGLPAGLPVVAGAGDQAAAAVGTGIVKAGQASVCLGTSGVVFAQTGRYQRDPEGILHAFCHAVRGECHVMGVMLSAGGALEWFARTFEPRASRSGGSVYDRVTQAAAEAPMGSGGVLFLPYLAGERCPHPDPDARATLHGMTLGTSYAHVARAVLEGIVAGLAECADRIRAAGAPLTSVRATGGGARSSFLMGLVAGALNLPVETAAVDEGSAYGAALLAGVGAGWATDVPSMAARWQRPGEAYQPRDAEREALVDVKGRRLALYRAIRAGGRKG